MRRELTSSLSWQEIQILHRVVSVLLLPKRIHLWLSAAKNKKTNEIAKVHSFNKYLLSTSYVLGPPGIYTGWSRAEEKDYGIYMQEAGRCPAQPLGSCITRSKLQPKSNFSSVKWE